MALCEIYYRKSTVPYLFCIPKEFNLKWDEFQEYYQQVHSEICEKDYSQIALEGLFERFNSESNPLLVEEKQEYIKKNNLHTSMSIADIIKLEDRYFIVSSCGFIDISFN